MFVSKAWDLNTTLDAICIVRIFVQFQLKPTEIDPKQINLSDCKYYSLGQDT